MKRHHISIGVDVAIQMLYIFAVGVMVVSCCERNYYMAFIGAAGKACLWLIKTTIDRIREDEDDEAS